LMFGWFFLFSLYLQFGRGYSPLSAGLATLPFAVTMVIVSPRSAALGARIGGGRTVASGFVLLRVISDVGKEKLAGEVRAAGFGVTLVTGEGREGEQEILFIVALRRRANELLELIRRIDTDAFVTIDPVQKAMGGYIPAGAASQMRK